MNIKLTTALCGAIMFLFAMILTITGPLLIEITRTYSLDMASSGIIFSVISLGFVIFVFINGFLSEKFGKKMIISICLIGLTFFLFIVLIVNDFLTLCIFMFFIGGFGGAIESLCSSLVADINSVKKIYYQNLIQVFFGLGAFIGPVGASLIVKFGFEWKLCFFILGILSLIITIFFIINKIEINGSIEITARVGIKDIFKDLKFVIICLCVFMYTGSEIGSWGWMSTFLKQNLDFSIFQAGLAVGIFWISMTIGRILWGEISLKVNIITLIMILSYSSCIVTLISIFINNNILIWIVVALLGFSFSSIWPFTVAYGGEYKKSSSGIVFAALIGSGGLGSTVIPYLMGIVGENFNTKIPMIIPSVLFIMIGIIFTFFFIKQKKHSKIIF